ncbi:hypothetical protein ATANTOWER_006115, partial [Ataeniobius toweri]|nr:hypothetical protein [Ataeniobius toweri]
TIALHFQFAGFCLLWVGGSPSLPSKASNLQDLLLSPHKGGYVLYVLLVTPSRSCSASQHSAPLHHSSLVPLLFLQTAIYSLSAAQRGREWGPFSVPPGIYLTLSWLSRREALMLMGQPEEDLLMYFG